MPNLDQESVWERWRERAEWNEIHRWFSHIGMHSKIFTNSCRNSIISQWIQCEVRLFFFAPCSIEITNKKKRNILTHTHYMSVSHSLHLLAWWHFHSFLLGIVQLKESPKAEAPNAERKINCHIQAFVSETFNCKLLSKRGLYKIIWFGHWTLVNDDSQKVSEPNRTEPNMQHQQNKRLPNSKWIKNEDKL